MIKAISGVFIMGFLSLNLTACATMIHNWKTGDGTRHFNTPITSDRIGKLIPSISTEKDVRLAFNNSKASQYTHLKRLLQIDYKGKQYRIDRTLIFENIPEVTEDLGNGIVRYGWTDRIYLAAFFYKNILQFYTVTHETKDKSGEIVWGPLDTGGNSREYAFPGADCAGAQYNVFELGKKDKYDLRKLKECGIPLDGE